MQSTLGSKVEDEVRRLVADMTGREIQAALIRGICLRLDRIEQHLGLVAKPEPGKDIRNPNVYGVYDPNL